MQLIKNFNCPNCNSTKYIGKTSMGKKYVDGPYKMVTSEIQCSKCFMDIPSNLSENIKKNDLNQNKKLWFEIYKPIHQIDAAKCSKCYRFYWEIEEKLFKEKISTKDIFYQTYNLQTRGDNLVCKICDPSAFN